MNRLELVRWAAAAALGIALVPGAASAADPGTITLTGTLDVSSGNSWSLTMYGTTHSHFLSGGVNHFTNLYAASFDLRFAGPDAAELNSRVSDRLAGGTASVQMMNGSGWSLLSLSVSSPSGAGMWAGHEYEGLPGNFPADADGYPIATPDPFPFWFESTYVYDGSDLYLNTWYDDATIAGDIGSPIPVTLSIFDGAVVEGNRGSTKLRLAVGLTNTSDQTITVSYRTIDGTALAKADYNSAGGTVTFLPGVTAQTILIPIKSDRRPEADETFTVELYDAVGAPIADAVATATIRNDD